MIIKHSLSRLAQKAGVRIFREKALPRGIDISVDINGLVESPVEVIFDVGANVGQTAHRFCEGFPRASIYSFEPIESTFESLVRNTRALNNVSCFKIALGRHKGEAKIYLQQNSRWNGLSHNLDQGFGSETVEISTVDEFRKINGIERIDLLKTDAEGYDLEVLKGADECLRENRVSFIFCEVGFNRHDPTKVHFCELLEYLDSRGFQLFDLYDTRTLFYIPHEHPRYSYCNALFVNTQIIMSRLGPAYERRLALRRERRGNVVP